MRPVASLRSPWLATLASVLILGSVAPRADAKRPDDAAHAQLKTEIQAKMDSVGIVGLAATVIVDREIVWQQGFGFADWRMSKPFTVDTAMNVASVTKPFVGVAMMQAVEAGQLDLDADISRYLPFAVANPHKPGAKITLRHLATHTSGITDRWEVYKTAYDYDGDPKRPLAEFLKDYFDPQGATYSPQNFLDAAPGELREYSNIASALAGYIVERATGEPLDALTKRLIFDPLKMPQTSWFMRDAEPALLSDLFASQNGLVFPIRPYGMVTYPDGGLKSSASDLSRFFLAVLNDGSLAGTRILSESSAKELQRFQFGDTNRPTNFPAEEGNSGLFWRTKFNGTRVGHGGSDPGVAVEMLSSLDKSVAVVLMSNTSLGGSDGAVMGDILDLLWKYGEGAKRRQW